MRFEDNTNALAGRDGKLVLLEEELSVLLIGYLYEVEVIVWRALNNSVLAQDGLKSFFTDCRWYPFQWIVSHFQGDVLAKELFGISVVRLTCGLKFIGVFSVDLSLILKYRLSYAGLWLVRAT